MEDEKSLGKFTAYDQDRYPMCEDQPVQLDCRDASCKYHIDGACTNISPAITLNTNGTVQKWVCWTKDME